MVYFGIVDDNSKIYYQGFNSHSEADSWVLSHNIYSDKCFHTVVTLGGLVDYAFLLLGTSRSSNAQIILKNIVKEIPDVMESFLKMSVCD